MFIRNKTNLFLNKILGTLSRSYDYNPAIVINYKIALYFTNKLPSLMDHSLTPVKTSKSLCFL